MMAWAAGEGVTAETENKQVERRLSKGSKN